MRTYFFILLLFMAANAFAQNSKNDSLLNLISIEEDDSVQTFLLLKLAAQNIDSDIEFTRKYAKQAWQKANDLELKTAQIELKNVFGNIYQRQTKNDSALAMYNEALALSKKIGYTAGLAKIYNNTAIIYTYTGEYEKAIALYFDAIKAEEKMGNMVGIAQAYNNIAVVYYQTRNFDKTVEYLKESSKILEKNNDIGTLKKTFINIAAISSYLGQAAEALEYYLKAYKISEKLDDKREMAICLGNMADCYTELKQFDKAFECLDKSIEIKRAEKNEVGICHDYGHYARLYSEMGNEQKATEYYEKAIAHGKKYKLKAELRELYKVYSQSLTQWGQSTTAYQMLELSYMINDSLVNEQSTKAIAELETKYETAQKEQTILQQEVELGEAALALATRKRWIIALSLSALLVVSIALFFVQRNKRLAQAEKDAAIITEREEGIKAIFEATENERKRIASDLHDGIGQQLSGLKLAFSRLGTDLRTKIPDDADKIDKLTAVLDDTCVEVRALSHEMMPKSLSESGLVSAIEGMLEKTLRFTGIQFEFEHMRMEQRLPEKVELSLYRVCQELINNVVKHSGATMVNIQLIRSKNNVMLLVEDNGKGIQGNAKDNSGIGLKNMASRMNSVNGEINFEPSPNAGTVATVRVPIAAA